MDRRLCPCLNQLVSSGICLGCSYMIRRLSISDENCYCSYNPDHGDYPFPIFDYYCEF